MYVQYGYETLLKLSIHTILTFKKIFKLLVNLYNFK